MVLGIVLQKEVPRMNDTKHLLRLPPNITKPRIQGGRQRKKKKKKRVIKVALD